MFVESKVVHLLVRFLRKMAESSRFAKVNEVVILLLKSERKILKIFNDFRVTFENDKEIKTKEGLAESLRKFFVGARKKN